MFWFLRCAAAAAATCVLARAGQVALTAPLNAPVAVMAVDAAGYIYVAGAAGPATQPTPGAFQRTVAKDQSYCGATPLGGGYAPCNTGYLAKIDPSGRTIVYLTYLGGNRNDVITALAVDAAGEAYVAGATTSSDFPATAGAMHAPVPGGAFIVKLNAAGSALVYGASIGGTDGATGIAVDSAGEAFVTGNSASAGFPVTAGAFQMQPGTAAAGGDSGFLLKLSMDGTALEYASYVNASPWAVAVGASGAAYVTGESYGSLSATPGAAQEAYGGGGDAFAMKVSADGTAVLYATYLGGAEEDVGESIAVDAAGSAYITGVARQMGTGVPTFPVTAGAYQTAFAGDFRPGNMADAFVTKLNAGGTALVYSTYLGGSSYDEGQAIAVDVSGEATVVGTTNSVNFPSTPDAYLAASRYVVSSYETPSGTFLSLLDAAGRRLEYSTFLTGTAAPAVAEGADGTAFTWAQADSGYTLARVDFSAEPPPLTLSGIANAAGFQGGVVSPGELVTVSGEGVGPGAEGVNVYFDELAAPVLAAGPGWVTVEAPFEVAGRMTVTVQLIEAGALSTAVSIPVAASVPGVYTTNGRGWGQAAILNEDGSPNSAANAAARGSVVSIFLTGTGLTNPPSGTGGTTGSSELPRVLAPVAAYLGTSVGAEILYAGAAPGLVAGVTQVNARIPPPAQTGSQVPFTVVVGDAEMAPLGLTMAIR